MIHITKLGAVIVLLAGLDVGAAIALKEAQLRSSPGLAMAGFGMLLCLGGALYYALSLAELTLVSLAWIVLYQGVAMAVDAFHYDVRPGRLQGAAIVVAMIALTVATVAPAAGPRTAAVPRPGPRHAAWSITSPHGGDGHDEPASGGAGHHGVLRTPMHLGDGRNVPNNDVGESGRFVNVR